MYFEEQGQGEPLLVLHGGLGRGVKNFEQHFPAFSKYFRIIAPDLRGHGRTDNPGGQLSYRLMADDVAAFVDVLDLKRPCIFGWSDGGQIALELGMNYPDLLRCMVVGAAWYRFSQHYQSVLMAMGFDAPGSVNIGKIEQVMPQMVQIWREFHASADDPDHWEKLAAQISTMWWTPLNYTPDDFHKIKPPTLILLGDRDQIIPVEEAVDMYHFIQGAELALVPQADHSLPRSRAELFTYIVLDFLLRHKSG